MAGKGTETGSRVFETPFLAGFAQGRPSPELPQSPPRQARKAKTPGRQGNVRLDNDVGTRTIRVDRQVDRLRALGFTGPNGALAHFLPPGSAQGGAIGPGEDFIRFLREESLRNLSTYLSGKAPETSGK